MPPKSVIACCQTLLEKNLKIVFAESATTGRLIYEFTSVPECGSVTLGSIVCYNRSVKENLLQIPPEIIDRYTAESAEVTAYLAEGLKRLIPADIIVAVTGLASEGGSETPDKPVGTMFVHGFIKEQPWQTRLFFEGDPDQIISQTIDAIAFLLLDKINHD